jgi:hypothetical protein
VKLTNHEIAGILLATAARHEERAAKCRASAAELTGTAAKPRRARKFRPLPGGGGSVHGRVLDILREHGAMRPALIVKAANAPDWQVRLACKELAADGKIIATGATINKTYALKGRAA